MMVFLNHIRVALDSLRKKNIIHNIFLLAAFYNGTLAVIGKVYCEPRHPSPAIPYKGSVEHYTPHLSLYSSQNSCLRKLRSHRHLGDICSIAKYLKKIIVLKDSLYD